MKIGYLGPEGSYSYMAVIQYAPDAELIQTKSLRKIIRLVEEDKVDQGILPIENSTEGAVTEVMDLLIKTKKSKIQREIILPVRHNLLSTGDDISKLKYILSHPQALEQTREYFIKNYPGIELIPTESTSRACEIVKQKGEEYAAIANEWAAKNNGLKILDKNIQDNFYNQTRFLIIGRNHEKPTGKDKTSIAFSFHNDFPGSLYMVLKEFAEREVNLTRIESRPAKSEMGKYIFYIDFIGHIEDEHVKEILENVEKITNRFKIFGSYPMGKIE